MTYGGARVERFPSWWMLWLARIFGERVVSHGEITLLGYYWRGVIYLRGMRL